MSLTFDPGRYETKTLTCDGITITYRAFEHLEYVENPQHPIQKISIYAPEVFYEGGSINGYTLKTAPIFMPNTVGGYMPGPEEAPGLNFMGQTNASFYALHHGYVVASAGVRGRRQKNYDGSNVVAPADIVDLKAAVRYLRHNADLIPGDVEKIITNGTSAGGAMSSLQGTTGNHPDYEPYLASLGAARERDDVFASSCYCPITNLDHADMAYEWEFNGLNDYHRMMIRQPETSADQQDGSAPVTDHPDLTKAGKPVFVPIDREMTDLQIRLSDELKPLFPAYFNSLQLKDADGTLLTMDADGNGRFTDLIRQHVLEAAQKEIDEKGTDLAADPSVTAWLTVEKDAGGHEKAVAVDWKGYIRFRTRMKSAPAFDDVALGTPETELFGSADIEARHFTDFSLAHDTAGGALADPQQIKMMNPMNYIDDPKATKAQHFRIRHGAVDRDTSLAISEILCLKLQNAGIDAEVAHPWGIPHAGDYDLPELFAWIDSICR